MTKTLRPIRIRYLNTSLLFVFLLFTQFGLSQDDEANDDEYVVDRTPWGDPDISGTYDIKTLTPEQRPRQFGDRQFITPDEAKAISDRTKWGLAQNSQRKDPNRGAPPQGGDGSRGPAGNVGGYNAFWIDNGEAYAELNGKIRTSIVYYPENGRKPDLTREAWGRLRAYYGSFGRENTGEAYWMEWSDRPGPHDHPESLTLSDRCIQGFSSTGGPPMMPALYNNLKRIVQGPDTIIILVEMVHDARIIRMNSEHLPDDVRRWMGDSIGWWEGDTLVVETTNFNDRPAQIPGSRNMRVEERFKMVDGDTLLYNFTVEDPTVWQDKWSGEYPWPKTDSKLYEYACHEGNYSMGNILRGARRMEREYLEKIADAEPEKEGE